MKTKGFDINDVFVVPLPKKAQTFLPYYSRRKCPVPLITRVTLCYVCYRNRQKAAVVKFCLYDFLFKCMLSSTLVPEVFLTFQPLIFFSGRRPRKHKPCSLGTSHNLSWRRGWRRNCFLSQIISRPPLIAPMFFR